MTIFLVVLILWCLFYPKQDGSPPLIPKEQHLRRYIAQEHFDAMERKRKLMRDIK